MRAAAASPGPAWPRAARRVALRLCAWAAFLAAAAALHHGKLAVDEHVRRVWDEYEAGVRRHRLDVISSPLEPVYKLQFRENARAAEVDAELSLGGRVADASLTGRDVRVVDGALLHPRMGGWRFTLVFHRGRLRGASVTPPAAPDPPPPLTLYAVRALSAARWLMAAAGLLLWLGGVLAVRAERRQPVGRRRACARASLAGAAVLIAAWGASAGAFEGHGGRALLAAMVLMAGTSLLLLVRRDRSAEALAALRRCPACGYDLRGNESGVCPECGKSTPGEALRRREAVIEAEAEALAAEAELNPATAEGDEWVEWETDLPPDPSAADCEPAPHASLAPAT